MIEYLLALALIGTACLAMAAGLSLYRLSAVCQRVERRTPCDRRLLRWYVQGFERPMRVTQWLLRSSLLLLFVSIVAKAALPLILVAVVLVGLSYAELRFGAQRERRHRHLQLKEFTRVIQ
jgi:multisubunit Na+/H+ antiporter MnhG subunit